MNSIALQSLFDELKEEFHASSAPRDAFRHWTDVEEDDESMSILLGARDRFANDCPTPDPPLEPLDLVRFAYCIVFGQELPNAEGLSPAWLLVRALTQPTVDVSLALMLLETENPRAAEAICTRVRYIDGRGRQ